MSALAPTLVAAWAAAQPASARQRMKLRDGKKGEVVAEFLTRRMFIWDDKARQAKHWHLLVRREIGGAKLKFCLSNAKSSSSLCQLVTMRASSHFVERALEDVKSACGMAEYQVGVGSSGIITWRWC